MKFLKKQRIRNAEKAEDCSEIEEMELRLKMMKEHLTIHLDRDRPHLSLRFGSSLPGRSAE